MKETRSTFMFTYHAPLLFILLIYCVVKFDRSQMLRLIGLITEGAIR